MDDNRHPDDPGFDISSGSTLALIIGLSVTAGFLLLPVLAYCLCRGCWDNNGNRSRPIVTTVPASTSVVSRRSRGQTAVSTLLGWPQNPATQTFAAQPTGMMMPANNFSRYPPTQEQQQQPQYRASDITSSGRPNAPPPSYMAATNYSAVGDTEPPPPYPGPPSTAYQTVTFSPRNS